MNASAKKLITKLVVHSLEDSELSWSRAAFVIIIKILSPITPMQKIIPNIFKIVPLPVLSNAKIGYMLIACAKDVIIATRILNKIPDFIILIIIK